MYCLKQYCPVFLQYVPLGRVVLSTTSHFTVTFSFLFALVTGFQPEWFYIIAGFLPLKWHTWKRKEIIDVSSYVTIWWNTRLSKIMRIQKRNKLFGKGKVLVRDYDHDHNMTIIINLSWYWHIGKMWDVTSVTDGRGWKVGWFTRFRKWSSPGCLT